MSSALESRLRQEGRAEAQAHAQAQIQALKQGRAEAQAAAQTQMQNLLQERDDVQVRHHCAPPVIHLSVGGSQLLPGAVCKPAECCWHGAHLELLEYRLCSTW